MKVNANNECAEGDSLKSKIHMSSTLSKNHQSSSMKITTTLNTSNNKYTTNGTQNLQRILRLHSRECHHMVKLLELPWTGLSIDPGFSSVELPWTGYFQPWTLNVTHVELESPLKKMR